MTKPVANAVNSDELADLDAPIWGGRAIAAEIRKSPMATYHLLEAGRIPARKVGNQWVSTKRRLRELTAPSS